MATVGLKTRFDADGKLQSKIGGINRGMRDFRKQLVGAKADAARSRASIDGLNRSLAGFHGALGKVGAVAGVYFGARAIGNALQYGAALGDAREQADALLRAQGTTADKVLPKLRASTRRMVSDLELLKLAAQGMTAQLTPADLELLGRASSAMANRTGASIEETFRGLQEGIVKGSRGSLAALGLTAQNLEGLTVPEKIARYRLELERVAAVAPSDSVVDKWQKLTTTLGNIRDRFAESITNAPEFLSLMERVNEYFNEERVDRWARRVAQFFDTFSVRKLLSNIELELARFLRTRSGRVLATVLGLASGAGAGARVGALVGQPGWGAAIGATAGLFAAGSALEADPIRAKAEALLDSFRRDQSSVTAEGLRDRFSPPWLLALRDEVEAMANERAGKFGAAGGRLPGGMDWELYKRLAEAQAVPERVRPPVVPRVAPPPVVVPGEPAKPGRALTERDYQTGADQAYRARANLTGGVFLGYEGLQRMAAKFKDAGEGALDAQGLAAAAAENLAASFYNLDLRARTVAQGLGSVLAGAGTGRLGDTISGKVKGGILPNLGLSLAMLGVGTLLSHLFGGDQQEQTRYLEAIARNTDRSAELLQRAIGTPEGFLRPTLGRPSYAGLSALAVADSRR